MSTPTNALFLSKVDAWLVILVVGAGAFALVPMASVVVDGLSKPSNAVVLIASALVVLLSVLLPIWLLLDTSYRLSGEQLTVRSGPFRWVVPLAKIAEVQPSRSVLSAPALSLDRIRIDYGAKSLLISPRERERFMDELRQRCPKAHITGF